MLGRVNDKSETEVIEFLNNESIFKEAFVKYYAQHKQLNDEGKIEAREKYQAIAKLKEERAKQQSSAQNVEGAHDDSIVS